ncbi:MAG: UvrB/UvrC motif-containing protein [Phycisphaeraceae bacterium]|nr:UvrB/UvrC motif-containing protein [Phycisphaeraceae bacterium]
MKRDLSQILAQWPFQPGQITARLIDGDDGNPRIQVRLDLGILQMCLDNRPDGERPMGFATLLDYFENARELQDPSDHPMAGGEDAESGGDGEDGGESGAEGSPDRPYSLSAADCRALREELAQVNQRCIALMAMEDFDRVARDASHNLRIMELCKTHAEREEDRTVLEQYRPYITALKTRALAFQMIKSGEPKAAALVLDDGLEEIKRLYRALGDPKLFETSGEAQLLKQMREELSPQLPISQRSELKRRLAEALEQENYELAAILRDELKQLAE